MPDINGYSIINQLGKGTWYSLFSKRQTKLQLCYEKNRY